jgi:hypothetical protein
VVICNIEEHKIGGLSSAPEGHKVGLPEKKTYTLKEYAGLRGDIDNPIGKDLDTYIRCRDEIKDCLDRIVEKTQWCKE